MFPKSKYPNCKFICQVFLVNLSDSNSHLTQHDNPDLCYILTLNVFTYRSNGLSEDPRSLPCPSLSVTIPILISFLISFPFLVSVDQTDSSLLHFHYGTFQKVFSTIDLTVDLILINLNQSFYSTPFFPFYKVHQWRKYHVFFCFGLIEPIKQTIN